MNVFALRVVECLLTIGYLFALLLWHVNSDTSSHFIYWAF
jgi:hypothetical protein